MIKVTENALRQLHAIAAPNSETGLRIAVGKGGCSGLHYEMTLGAGRAGDEVVERDGLRFFIEGASVEFLRGATLDYNDALTGAGFQIVNPNAARTCGCGSSFEPAKQ